MPESLVSRDGFSRPVPRQPAHLHTQAEYGAYLRDSCRVPRRRPFMKPPYAIGSVPSLWGHAITYRWRSLPRVRRHRASKPQGSSERVLPWQVTMDQCIFASLSHTHYWCEVGMLKVPYIWLWRRRCGGPPLLTALPSRCRAGQVFYLDWRRVMFEKMIFECAVNLVGALHQRKTVGFITRWALSLSLSLSLYIYIWYRSIYGVTASPPRPFSKKKQTINININKNINEERKSKKEHKKAKQIWKSTASIVCSYNRRFFWAVICLRATETRNYLVCLPCPLFPFSASHKWNPRGWERVRSRQ